MKRIIPLLLIVSLLGAGCPSLGGGSKAKVADGGVFKTSDAGKTWTQVSAVPTVQGMGTLADSNVISMEADPKDKFFLYATTRNNGMVYSEDGAISWHLPRHAAFRDGTIQTVEVDPSDSCTAYFAKGARLYKTTDCMRTFDDEVYVESRGGIRIQQIVVDWYVKGTVWIGLSNGDVLKSTDKGKSWKTVLKINKEISEIFMNQKDSRVMLISTFDSGIQRTTDGGEHWEKLEGTFTEFPDTERVYAITQTKDGSVMIAATQYGLLRSKDLGSSWEAIDLLTSPGQLTIRAVGVAPKDPKIIYFVAPNTFYRTNDGGQTWQTQKFPSSRVPRVLLIDPDDASVLYVGVAAVE
jgi:photosystem II stability/assembly factor-like uncharacterized protein